MSEADIFKITLVIVGGILLFGLLLAFTVGRQQSKRSKALQTISGRRLAPDSAEAQSGREEQKEKDRQRADISKKLKEKQKEEDKKDKISLKQMLEQAGLETPIFRFWMYSIFSGLLFFGLMSLVGANILVQIFMGIFGFLGFPRWFLKRKIARRQKKFLEDFADALEAMVRLLQAGMPVTEAVSMVAREYRGPLGDEMTMIYEDQKVGATLGQAVQRGAKRVPLTEMKMFATAVTIQAETGSSLSEVLTNLAGIIRARFRLKRKIKALSAEAKASAGIIGALPILVSGGLYAVNPDYISLLFTETIGNYLIAGASIWMLIGIIIMKQMINFRI